MHESDEKTKSCVELTMENVDHETWDALSDEFEDSSPEQTSVFSNERWGKHRINCVILKRGDELIGGACIVVFAVPLLGRGIAYIKHGPLWRRTEASLDLKTYRASVELLVDELGRRQGHAVLLVPRPSPKSLQGEEKTLRHMGFTTGRKTTDPNRYLVNATLDKDDQMQSLGQKWRYHLRRSLKNDLTISAGHKTEDFETFKSLYQKMISRKKFDSTDPIDALPQMLTNLPETMRPTVFLAAHNNKPVAGVVVCICGDTAYYVFGASNHQALPLKAGYALQWSVLEFLRNHNVDWYDLGGEAGMSGLSQFKKGLVGKQGVILRMPGELQYCNDFAARLISWSIFLGKNILSRLRS